MIGSLLHAVVTHAEYDVRVASHGAEALAALRQAPFQDQLPVRALVFEFLWNHALMLYQWADRTEAVLAEWEACPPGERTVGAAAAIRQNLARDPAPGAH